MRNITFFIFMVMSILGNSNYSYCQIKNFEELHSIIQKDDKTIKRILESMGYTHSKAGEIAKGIYSDIWVLVTPGYGRTGFGFSTAGKEHFYTYIDTTYSFGINTYAEMAFSGYGHPEKNLPQLFSKNNECLIIWQASFGPCYLLSKNYKGLWRTLIDLSNKHHY